MTINLKIFLLILAFACVSQANAVECTTYTDCRYQGAPIRDSSGLIVRSNKVLSAFKKIHPCPATGLTTGSCTGWSIDHVISLDCGGIDAVYNLQWLPLDIKSCAGIHCKDRFERKIYSLIPPLPDTKNCRNQLVK